MPLHILLFCSGLTLRRIYGLGFEIFGFECAVLWFTLGSWLERLKKLDAGSFVAES